MQTIDLLGDSVRVTGAMELDQSPEGIGIRRLPAWTRPQIPDPFMDAMVSMCSGVRIEFEADAEVIELEAAVTSFRYEDEPPRPQVLQLVIDGEETIDAVAHAAGYFVLDFAEPPNVRFEGGGTSIVRFAGLGEGRRQFALWLPHTATIRIHELRVDDDATVTAPRPTGRPVWVHYGSSISHCLEADVPTGTWPAVAARLAGVDLHSFGFAGQCQLDQFVARAIRDTPADLITLKVGINLVNADSMRERTFLPAVNGFLDTVREGHPDTPILVVSPICCPIVEDHPGPTFAGEDGLYGVVSGSERIRAGCLTLRRIRELLATLVEVRAKSDPNLSYLNGLELFGEGDVADLEDRLHPNAAGYQRMGERFAALVFGRQP